MHSKVLLTQARIVEFYGGYHPGMYYGDAYVSFSGGKDSTVLLDIARKIYPEIPAVFSNTGLEYPEIRKFAMSHDNVEMVQPKMRFDEVISQYGYPLIGKEVAEAIYYARRLRPDKRERERESSPERRTPWGNCLPTSQTDWRRIEICGKRMGCLTRAEERAIRAGVTGIPMNRAREIDGSCTDSKAEPG